MRRPLDIERVRQLMRELGRRSKGPGRVYLVGGTSAVLLGWRASTVDADLIRPHLLRYPALDPDAFAARVAQWA